MSEIEQLKERINKSGTIGVETARIRDDYEPVGDLMIRDLCATGKYVQMKVPAHSYDQSWRIFEKRFAPY